MNCSATGRTYNESRIATVVVAVITSNLALAEARAKLLPGKVMQQIDAGLQLVLGL